MHILFLDSIEADVYGGMEEWIRLVGGGLHQRGHNVTVAGRKHGLMFERIAKSSPEVKHLELTISGDFNPFTIASLNKYIEQQQVEIVVVNFNKDIRLGGIAARYGGYAKVVWSVGLDITRDSVIHRWLTPKLLDGVLVTSEALKAQITRHGYIDPGTVEVIPIGIPRGSEIDCAARLSARSQLREKYDLRSDAIVAVTVGRFVDQKGHCYLVEGMQKLADRYPELHLLWCGSGPLEQRLRAQAAELGVANRIHFAGMLSDLVLELNGSDLMIHPSVEEPFGIALLEGMRAGLPIVASRVGGIPEVLGKEYAFFVGSKSPEGISDAVDRMLTDRKGMPELGVQLRKRFAAEFDQELMLDRLEGYFKRQVVTERHHG